MSGRFGSFGALSTLRPSILRSLRTARLGVRYGRRSDFFNDLVRCRISMPDVEQARIEIVLDIGEYFARIRELVLKIRAKNLFFGHDPEVIGFRLHSRHEATQLLRLAHELIGSEDHEGQNGQNENLSEA